MTDSRATPNAAARPQGIHCCGCARRFVPAGQPTSGPLDSVRWREGLCDRSECNDMVNNIIRGVSKRGR